MRRPLLAAFALLLALAVPAPAQQHEGVLVARHGEVELRVHDDDGALCVGFAGRSGTSSSACGDPLEPYEGGLAGHSDGGRAFVGGAVPSEGGTAAVELQYAGGARVRVSATAGSAYRGRLRGKVVFFIAEVTSVRPRPEEEPVLVRRLDASGKLVGAASGGHEGGVVAGPQSLRDRGGLRVQAYATMQFSPSVLELDRLERQICLKLAHRAGSGGACMRTGPAYPTLELRTHKSCDRGTVVHGFAAPAATAVELTLGSGRRMRVATRDVSALGTAARAVLAVAPRREAVRSARALDAAGAEIHRQDIAAPPPDRCGRNSGILSTFGTFSYGSAGTEDPAPAEGQQVAVVAPGGARLIARDEGEEHLCVGVDGLAADRHDCVVPPPAAHFPEFDVDAGDARTAVGGIVPGSAAGVRIELDGRRMVAAAITDGGEYSGRFRGHLRFFLAEAPGRHRVTAIETVDAAGKLVSRLPGPGAEGPPTRTIGRGRGFRLIGGRFEFRFKLPGERMTRHRVSCLGVVIGRERPAPEMCGFVSPSTISGRVACSPRVGVLLGRLTKRIRGVRLTLADGGTISSRAIRIPRRLGGGRLWVLRIPANVRVTRLRYLGERPGLPFGSRNRARQPVAGRFDVAPPARQCGYALPDPTF